MFSGLPARLIENIPFRSVVVPMVTPFTCTVAPISGSPVAASVTVPETVRGADCAYIPQGTAKIPPDNTASTINRAVPQHIINLNTFHDFLGSNISDS